jgi:predicted metalloprotease with PDZ domain
MPPVKAQAPIPQIPVHYRVRCLDPHAHVFEVSCTVSAPDPAGQRLTLPTWTPGSYLVREFARHFVKVTAQSKGKPVTISKVSKDTWRAAPCKGALTVTAEIYAFDLSVRTAYLDASRAYFNGASVFLCPEGFADKPSTLEIVAPAHAEAAKWRVATTMDRADAKSAPVIGGFGLFKAADYDELIDHPVELGTFTSGTFDAGGVQHTLAITGQVDIDMPRVCADLARICQAQCDLFGGKAPFARYLFLTLALEAGHGGLEHRSSTSLICRRDALPRPGDTAPSDAYDVFLGLASHEYFHSWNVKRIKPAAFVPYDLTRENYTRQLWAFEGITSYYDDLMLARSGVVTPEKYLEIVARTLTSVLRVPGRHVQSVADASFDAWIKYYRQDENTPNAGVSYYHKGALVALALDLTLRRHGTSLDAVMQALWSRHGSTGVGVPEDGHARIASELARTDLGEFFRRHVDGVEDPPLAELLADVGVTLQLRAADGGADRGGSQGKPGAARRCTLGASWTTQGDLRLTNVLRAGAAARAGLSAQDALVAIDGMRASAERLEGALLRSAPGSVVRIDAFRRDQLHHFDVQLDAAPLDTAYLALAAGASAATRKRRRAWLFG